MAITGFFWKAATRMYITLHPPSPGPLLEPCYDGYKGLRGFTGVPQLLTAREAKVVSAINTSHTVSSAQQNRSQKSTFYTWLLQRFHLSYLKTATNQRCIQKPFQVSVPSPSLINPIGFTTPWAICHRHSLSRSPRDMVKEEEWKVDIWCPMSILSFLNLKYNVWEN